MGIFRDAEDKKKKTTAAGTAGDTAGTVTTPTQNTAVTPTPTTTTPATAPAQTTPVTPAVVTAPAPAETVTSTPAPTATQTTSVTPAATTPAPTPATSAAVVPEGDAMARFTQILGKSPEEKAAEEEKLRRASLSQQAVMRFFDGLRYLGYSAGFSRNVPAVQLADSSAPIAQAYQDARAQRQKADAESAEYKLKLYQMMQNEKRQKQQDEALEREKRRQDEADQQAREKRQEESRYNKARTEYQEKLNAGLPQKQEDAHNESVSRKNKNDKYTPGSKKTSSGKATDNVWDEYENYLAEHPDETPSGREKPKTKDQAHEWLAEHRKKHSKGKTTGKGGKSGSGKGKTSKSGGKSASGNKYGNKFK